MKIELLYNKSKTAKNFLAFGGIASALAASACCILPLILFVLGIGGAWVSYLTALHPFRPYFIASAILFVGIGFYRIYSKPKTEECAVDSFCARPHSHRINKIALWTAAVLVGLAALWPYIAPFLLEWIG